MLIFCNYHCKSQSSKEALFPKDIPDSTFAIILINNMNCSSVNYDLDEKISNTIYSNPNITFKVITNTIERLKEVNYYRRLWKLKSTDILVGNNDSLSVHLFNLFKIDNIVSKWNSCLVIRKDNKIIVKLLNPN